jgi:hypothetical protein
LACMVLIMLSICPVLVGYPLRPRKTLLLDWFIAACALDANMPNIRGNIKVKRTRLLLFFFISLFLNAMN